MSLQITPEVEATIRQYAEREGVSIDELLTRMFPPIASTRSRVSTMLREWQLEYGLPTNPTGLANASAAELVRQWNDEDNDRSPELIQSEQQLWDDLEKERTPVTI